MKQTKWNVILGDKDVFAKVKIGRKTLNLRCLEIPSSSWKKENEIALLIASAPEMLEMLESILNDNYNHSEKMLEIEQLIKQATEL